MIIDIGTEVDESVIRWKHKETDEWQKADIDELIDAYESIVRCKDCRWRKGSQETKHNNHLCKRALDQNVEYWTKADDFCSYGERREE